ncbi:hypothetical protein [Streptomyces sp. NPDC007264]|uniref:hypothetical protein n=1 Tax=Streptomyces sp. NPDC007264 TaxID=3364777 RepID=UPI0036D89BCA
MTQTSGSGSATETETERLRAAFADAAHDVTPGPVPLAVIERAGRARRRLRAAGLTAGCGLLVATLTVTAVQGLAPDPPPTATTPATAAPTATGAPTPSPTFPSDAPKAVRAGERAHALPGVEVWLTEEGEHWSVAGFEQFRSVVDGNIDMNRPGVSYFREGLDDTGDHDSSLVHGIYYGTRKAARVTLTKDGTVTEAAMLELRGNPNWGVYYLTVPATGGGKQTVTVYDKAGRVLADLTVDN